MSQSIISKQSRMTSQSDANSTRFQRTKTTLRRIASGAVLLAGLMIPGMLHAEACPTKIVQSKAVEVTRLRFREAILMEDISSLRRRMGISTDLPARLHTYIKVDRVRGRVRSTLSSDCGASKSPCPIPVSRIENWGGEKIRGLTFIDPETEGLDSCVLKISEDVPVIPDLGAPKTLPDSHPATPVEEKVPAPKALPKTVVATRPEKTKTAPTEPAPLLSPPTRPSKTPSAPRPSEIRPPNKAARRATLDESKLPSAREAELDVPHHTEMVLDSEGFISHHAKVRESKASGGVKTLHIVQKTRMCGMREIKQTGVSYMAWQIYKRHIRDEVDSIRREFSIGNSDAFIRIPITAIPGGKVELKRISLFVDNKRDSGAGDLRKRLPIDLSSFAIAYPAYVKSSKSRGEPNTDCIFVLDIPLDNSLPYKMFIDDKRLVDVVER